MSLATTVLAHIAAMEKLLKSGVSTKAVAHPEVDVVLIRQQRVADVNFYTLGFMKGGEKVPVPSILQPKPDVDDPFGPFRSEDKMQFLKLPVDGAGAVLCALDDEGEEVKFQAEFDALVDLGTGEGGIDLYNLICEPGYDKTKKGWCIANWNHISDELCRWLESEGYDVEWSDEWTTCSDCGGLIRTQPSGYGWKRYSVITDGEEVCGDCLKKDPIAYFEGLEGKSKTAALLDLDPEAFGYVMVNLPNKEFQNGWHPHQTDNPEAMSKKLRLNGVSRFLWHIPSVGQFDVTFNLYIHESIKDQLGDIRLLLGILD